jgi:hypothetical protein
MVRFVFFRIDDEGGSKRYTLRKEADSKTQGEGKGTEIGKGEEKRFLGKEEVGYVS